MTRLCGTSRPSRSSEDTTSVTPFVSSVPPSLLGLHTSASSKRDAGGKASPFVCGTSPVALHTAVISMPDLVPSTNELNIFGLIELWSVMFRYLSRMSQRSEERRVGKE